MLGLFKYNFKLILTPSYVVGWLFILVLPFALSFNLLTEAEMANITQKILILVGIIWFGNLANIEQIANVNDLVNQMKVKQTKILFMRMFIMFLSMILAFSLLLFYASLQGASFHFFKLLSGSIVGSLTLGLLALLFSQLSSEIAVGYMVSFAYYFFELITKGSLTRYFYLFGSIYEMPYNRSLLLGVCFLLALMNWMILNRRIINSQ